MRQSRLHLAAVAAAAALLLAAQAHAVVNIAMGTANGSPGSIVSASATLSTGDAMVAGTQNDFAFDPSTPVAAKATGKPDCTAKVKLDGSQFAFQPPGCTPGTDCTAVRAIIISFSDLSPIPDGTELYECHVTIASDATPGDKALTCSGAGASDPDGNALDTTCTNGTITVAAQPVAIIHVGSTSGTPGESGVTFDTTLETVGDTMVAGTQNDVNFSGSNGAIAIPAKENGKPDCTAKVKTDGSQFAFEPAGCTPGTDCVGVRAIIISFSDLSPIPNGTVMYTCSVQINSSAETGSSYPLNCVGAGASDPGGVALETSCTDGSVSIPSGPSPTPTASPSATPTVTPEKSSTVTQTPTNTKKPTNTPGGGGGGNDDDACAIVSPATSQSGWMLLLPAAALLWLRRRSR